MVCMEEVQQDCNVSMEIHGRGGMDWKTTFVAYWGNTATLSLLLQRAVCFVGVKQKYLVGFNYLATPYIHFTGIPPSKVCKTKKWAKPKTVQNVKVCKTQKCAKLRASGDWAVGPPQFSIVNPRGPTNLPGKVTRANYIHH